MAFYFTKFPSSRKIEEADLVLEYVSEECLSTKYNILWNILFFAEKKILKFDKLFCRPILYVYIFSF